MQIMLQDPMIERMSAELAPGVERGDLHIGIGPGGFFGELRSWPTTRCTSPASARRPMPA